MRAPAVSTGDEQVVSEQILISRVLAKRCVQR